MKLGHGVEQQSALKVEGAADLFHGTTGLLKQKKTFSPT